MGSIQKKSITITKVIFGKIGLGCDQKPNPQSNKVHLSEESFRNINVKGGASVADIQQHRPIPER